MVSTDAFALQRSDLNLFLFADIGTEASSMNLSVISALSRLGLDPWQEAARLARLPRNAAAEGLAKLIAAMPASLWPLADARLIAARLVALLPSREAASRRPVVQAEAWRFKLDRQWIILAALALAVLGGLAVRLAGTPDAPDPVPLARSAPAHPPTSD